MNIESKMEVYEANYSYNQQADSVLTFNAGEKFYILGRPTDKWWFAKRLVDNMFGYVPAAYLQPAKEKVIGKLVPEKRRDTKEHNIHLEALAEIHRKVKPLPAHVIENALAMDAKPQSPSAKSGPATSSVLSSRKMITIEDEEDLPEHLHNLNISGRSEGEHILIPDEDEEDLLIKPRPLVNPVLNSKERQDLHRELKQSGKKVLEQPELKKVFRDRRITEKKKEAERHEESRRTSMEIKLMERQEMLEKEEQRQKMAREGIVENDEDALKPEFAKLKLRQTNSSKT